MSRPITPEELRRLCPGASASTLRRNAAERLATLIEDGTALERLSQPPKKRLRQSSKGPNKWEREYAAILRERGLTVWEHPLKLKLGNGVLYEVDLMACRWETSFAISLYEVKGFMRDDAAVKLKVAASLYPCFVWMLVWKDKNGWHTQRIIP